MGDVGRPAFSGSGLPIVIAFPAEVDAFNAVGLGEELCSAITLGGPPVVPDLARTWFLDAAGVRMLIAAHTRAIERGAELRVAEPGALVARVFQLTGADRVLRIYPTVTAALVPVQH